MKYLHIFSLVETVWLQFMHALICVFFFSPTFRSCDRLIQVLENGAANHDEVVSSVLKEQATWVKVRLIRIILLVSSIFFT